MLSGSGFSTLSGEISVLIDCRPPLRRYGEYLSKSGLLRPGVKVLCREKMADLKVGDLGEYVSTEPINPPLSIFFRRVNGQRFLDWHQVEVIVDLWAVEGGDPIPTPLSSDESAFSATGGVYE